MFCISCLKDRTFCCFLRGKNVNKWLLFTDLKPVVSTSYYDVILLKIARLGLDPRGSEHLSLILLSSLQRGEIFRYPEEIKMPKSEKEKREDE